MGEPTALRAIFIRHNQLAGAKKVGAVSSSCSNESRYWSGARIPEKGLIQEIGFERYTRPIRPLGASTGQVPPCAITLAISLCTHRMQPTINVDDFTSCLREPITQESNRGFCSWCWISNIPGKWRTFIPHFFKLIEPRN